MPSRSQPSTRRRLTLEPVASSAVSNSTSSLVESVATRASASSFVTLVRVRTSIRCSSHHSPGRKSPSSRFLLLEVPLRQRRPVVQAVGLMTHEQDRALAALFAQPARAVRGGQPAADQEMVCLAPCH